MSRSHIKDDIFVGVKPKDLLKKLSLKDQTVDLDINIPNSFYQSLLSQVLERDYLNGTADKEFFLAPQKMPRVNWIQITRLPVHPNENESYDLLSRWQGVLTSLHAWGYRLLFLLLRYEGTTKLFLGAVSTNPSVNTKKAAAQLQGAVFGSMPGMCSGWTGKTTPLSCVTDSSFRYRMPSMTAPVRPSGPCKEPAVCTRKGAYRFDAASRPKNDKPIFFLKNHDKTHLSQGKNIAV